MPYLFDFVDAAADTSVHAENLVLDDRRERQVVKQLVDTAPHEHTRLIAKALEALKAEAEQRVDIMCLYDSVVQICNARHNYGNTEGCELDPLHAKSS